MVTPLISGTPRHEPSKPPQRRRVGDMRTPMKTDVTEADRLAPRQWITRRAARPRRKLSARIVRMTAEGRPTAELMPVLGVCHPALNRWRQR